MKTLSSIRVTARGSLDTEGVYKDLLDSTYYWHPVRVINCLHCTYGGVPLGLSCQ